MQREKQSFLSQDNVAITVGFQGAGYCCVFSQRCEDMEFSSHQSHKSQPGGFHPLAVLWEQNNVGSSYPSHIYARQRKAGDSQAALSRHPTAQRGGRAWLQVAELLQC